MNYGRYQIVNELGRGSMGVVYKAHDPKIDRHIALKVLREDRVTSEDFVKRFFKEAKAVGRLSHPGIVTVYDVGQDHGTVYIAMEFLEGTPLDELLKNKKFSQQEIVDIGLQTTQALLYAHRNGIVHRDIKPPNIIYSPEGSIRVTDFGIARIEDPNAHQLTQAGEILGTPLYMSPEQVMGQPLDGRSDLYSLGVILYLLSTGKRPFQESTLAAIFRAITTDTPEPPHVVAPEVPLQLSELIMTLLDKEPAKRYENDKTLIDTFISCLDRRQSEPAPLPPTSPPISPKISQRADSHQQQPTAGKQETRNTRGKVFTGSLLGLVFFIGLAGYFFLRPDQDQPLPIKPVKTTEITAKTTITKNNTSNTKNDANTNGQDNSGATALTPITIKQSTTDEGSSVTTNTPSQADPAELIRQAIALSVTATDLPKKELVLASALELVKISPRYQKDMEIAEKMYNTALEKQDERLELYLQEIESLYSGFPKEEVQRCMVQAENEAHSSRQKNVISLLDDHLKSLQNGAKLVPAKVLEDFSQRFNTFAD